MKKLLSMTLVTLVTNCKPLNTNNSIDDSLIQGLTSEKINSNERPDYYKLGTINGSLRKITGTIFILNKSDSTAGDNIASKRALLTALDTLVQSSLAGNAKIKYGDKVFETLELKNLSKENFRYAPSEADVIVKTNNKDKKFGEKISEIQWEFKIKITAPTVSFAEEYGTDLANKDIVMINGHIITESIENKLKPISDRYKPRNVSVSDKTGDRFIDMIYFPAMKKFHSLIADEKKEKLRILVLNSCYSEFLENMVFNASAKVKVVEENLLMISQRSQSHFGAFWKQIPQFIANIQVGGNYKSLVDSLKINDSDRKSSKIPINLEIKPVLMRHTFFNKQ